MISARAVGRHLYVSSLTGVTIFDITTPRAPVRVGRLDLPNAQNEDVDVGSGILLVSDDPYGGRGIVHVIDVRDPANPRRISTLDTWARGLADPFAVPRRRGIGHTVSCIQQCRWAWLAGSSGGIDIVDLRDPANPRIARRFPAREAAGIFGTHDVQVDRSGLAWVAGSRGTAAYDTSNPLRPRLVFRTNRAGGLAPLNDFIHHNSLRIRRNVVAITEEDFRDRCASAGSLQTWRIRGRRAPMKVLDTFGVERDGRARVACSAHYFDARDGLIAQGFYEQGVRFVDASNPRRLRQVGFYIDRPGLVWGAVFAPTDPTGSTVYSIDHTRGIDVLTVNRARLRPVRRRGARRVAAQPQAGLRDGDLRRLRRGAPGPAAADRARRRRPRRPGRRDRDAPARADRRTAAGRRRLRPADAHAELADLPAARLGGAARARACGTDRSRRHPARGDRLRARAERPDAARRSWRGPRRGRRPGAARAVVRERGRRAPRQGFCRLRSDYTL